MTKVDDILLLSSTISDISEDEYKKVGVLIDTFEAVARVTYQGVYIIDYYQKKFLYVSENPTCLCGHTAKEVQELGPTFYNKYVPAQEQLMLAEINKSGTDFYRTIPVEDRQKYTISYDVHIVNGRKKVLVNHKLTPVLLTDEGKIWLAVCILSLPAHSTPGHVVMRRIDRMTFWEYSFGSHSWETHERASLSEREKDILSLSAQGYTMSEIAEKLCVGLNTIKFHKKNLFDKLQVKNITEALLFAINYKLL